MSLDTVREHSSARVAELEIWFGRVEPVPLTGGITNQNFAVEDRGRRYVVRVGSDIPVHGVVRANELAASRAAHLADLSPRVVHAEPGILVLDFIEGRTFTPEDVRNPANLERLIDMVRRCHRDIPQFLRGPGVMFWVFHVVRDYGHTLREGEQPPPCHPGRSSCPRRAARSRRRSDRRGVRPQRSPRRQLYR